jgi:DNA-binding NarL/FixJ family response regulator
VRQHPSVCLLSSHPLVLEEFRSVLTPRGFNLEVHRIEPNLLAAVEKMEVPASDVYVIDGQVPDAVTQVLVARIQQQQPAARQLVLGDRFDESNAFPLLRLGVKGLLTYAQAREALPFAIESVWTGGFWVPRILLSRFVDWVLRAAHAPHAIKGPTDLSARERQVLDALLDNRSNKEIGEDLHISERTVKFHVSRLLEKFSVRRRTDLILLWFQNRSDHI